MTLPDTQARAPGEAPLAHLAVLALMTSVVAQSIDAVLPALDAIPDHLGFANPFADPDDRHLAIMLVPAGLGTSQALFGQMAMPIGGLIASTCDRKFAPLSVGFTVLGLAGLLLMSARGAMAKGDEA